VVCGGACPCPGLGDVSAPWLRPADQLGEVSHPGKRASAAKLPESIYSLSVQERPCDLAPPPRPAVCSRAVGKTDCLPPATTTWAPKHKQLATMAAAAQAQLPRRIIKVRVVIDSPVHAGDCTWLCNPASKVVVVSPLNYLLLVLGCARRRRSASCRSQVRRKKACRCGCCCCSWRDSALQRERHAANARPPACNALTRHVPVDRPPQRPASAPRRPRTICVTLTS
jgi:hypothetical protein